MAEKKSTHHARTLLEMLVVILKQQLEENNQKNKKNDKNDIPWFGRIVANNIPTLQEILTVIYHLLSFSNLSFLNR